MVDPHSQEHFGTPASVATVLRLLAWLFNTAAAELASLPIGGPAA